MKLELTIFSSLCSTDTFKVNNIVADRDDFGLSYDTSPETAEEYGCGSRVFEGIEATSEILAKYSITKEEYLEIVCKLEEGLSFGSCGWCV
jgi:hypothetical protein